MTTYDSKEIGNGLSSDENKLLKALREADPETRLRMCCNLARAGNWSVVGGLGEPGLLESVRRAIRGDNIDLDTSRAVNVSIGEAGGLLQ